MYLITILYLDESFDLLEQPIVEDMISSIKLFRFSFLA